METVNRVRVGSFFYYVSMDDVRADMQRLRVDPDANNGRFGGRIADAETGLGIIVTHGRSLPVDMGDADARFLTSLTVVPGEL